jgi:hypothetical protein
VIFRLSGHAQKRIAERQISAEELAAALAGRCRISTHGGAVEYKDSRSGVVIVVDRVRGMVVTAYRLEKEEKRVWQLHGKKLRRKSWRSRKN